jgi:hypothetical protein
MAPIIGTKVEISIIFCPALLVGSEIGINTADGDSLLVGPEIGVYAAYDQLLETFHTWL